MNSAFVYFVKNTHSVRVGSSGFDKVESRITTHYRNGLDLCAIIPGTVENENYIHEFYKDNLIRDSAGNPRDTSTYSLDALAPYVDRLLQFQYATTTIKKVKTWSRVPFELWKPDKVVAPLWDRDQGTLFVVDGLKSDILDTYETPEEVLIPCRAALGGIIDLDPCTTSMANDRVGALSFYDEHRNGLILPWLGTVFCNPPYGGKNNPPTASLFIMKLIHELDVGNTTAAITVLNLQSWPTKWFPQVWNKANSHAVWNSRIDFIRPRNKNGSKPFSSSKNGTVFSYFGANPDLFEKTFRYYASVFRRSR